MTQPSAEYALDRPANQRLIEWHPRNPMKKFSLPAALLLFAVPLFAQQPETAPASELAKLRQGYVESLNRLLQQHVKSNDIAAAAVSRELDKVTGSVPDLAPNTSPCGTWWWPGGTLTTVAADGIATNPQLKTKGIWHWIDESKHQLQIEWQNGFIDKVTVSPDGTRLNGINNFEIRFIAERLPAPEKGSAVVTMK